MILSAPKFVVKVSSLMGFLLFGCRNSENPVDTEADLEFLRDLIKIAHREGRVQSFQFKLEFLSKGKSGIIGGDHIPRINPWGNKYELSFSGDGKTVHLLCPGENIESSVDDTVLTFVLD